MNEKLFVIGDKIAWEDLGGGVRRKIIGYLDNLMLVLAEFQKGAEGKPHTHPHEQVSYVLKGKFEVLIGEEKQVLSEGDGYIIPPDVLHGAKCLEAGILIDTFSPMREDFV